MTFWQIKNHQLTFVFARRIVAMGSGFQIFNSEDGAIVCDALARVRPPPPAVKRCLDIRQSPVDLNYFPAKYQSRVGYACIVSVHSCSLLLWTSSITTTCVMFHLGLRYNFCWRTVNATFLAQDIVCISQDSKMTL